MRSKKKIIRPKTKICTKCGIEKDLNKNNFYFREKRNSYELPCIECRNEEQKQYYKQNITSFQERNKEYTKEHKEELAKKNKEWREKKKLENPIPIETERQCKNCKITKPLNEEYFIYNGSNIRNGYSVSCIECTKTKLKEKAHRRYEKHKTKIIADAKEHYQKNKDKKKEYNKQYRKKNRKKITEYQNKRVVEKYNSDPVFYLRYRMSGAIRDGLSYKDGSKKGKSILQYLPYTMAELKIHIENQFESWMNWNNHGRYNPNTWDEKDTSTWTWQIDHIDPHANFQYKSMEDETFQQCWALSNLRPYSAKKNNEDGGSRIRHKKHNH